MHYFLTNKFEYNFSGIEYAACYRIDVFKSLKVPSVIVTFDFTPELDLYLYRHKIDRADSLNMFDFYQQVDRIDNRLINDNRRDLNINWNDSDITYYDRNRLAEYKGSKHNIKSVMVINHETNEKILYCFDVRGFLSQLIKYNSNGEINEKQWLDNEGNVVLIENVSDKTITITKFNRQYALDGSNVYYSWSDLKSSWLDFIIHCDSQAILYIDRGEYCTPIVLNMKESHKRVFVVLHSAHTVDRQHPMSSKLNEVRQLELNHKQAISGYIASTKVQADDFYNRTGFKTYTIPVSYTKNLISKAISFNSPNNIVYLSRISREKRIEDIIMAAALVKHQIQNVHVSVYGYVTDPVYNNELHQLISELGLMDYVSLLPYNPDKKAIFSTAKLFVLTSFYEGFNMSMLEAASFGVPSVAYDVLYGPKEIIHKLSNGILVNSGNINQLVTKIVRVLSDESLYSKLSNNSIKNIKQEFGLQKIKKLWLSFLESEELLAKTTEKFIYGKFSENTALRSSNIAAVEFARKRGMSVIEYPSDINQLNSWLSNFQPFDKITLFYPSFINTMPTNGQYDEIVINNLKKLHTCITLIVADSLILRELPEYENSELRIFEMVDNLYFPTLEMKNYFLKKGIKTSIGRPFSFYPVKQGINQGNVHHDSSVNISNIIYTGNLGKATFLEQVSYRIGIEAFGPNVNDSILNNTDVHYRGNLDFTELNAILYSFDGFGLIWDGDLIPGHDKESRYTRYNVPYKGISYIANGIPVIAWEKSAFAHIIKKYKIGIILPNLNHLQSSMDDVSKDNILLMKKNVMKLRKKLIDTNIIL